MTDLPDDAGLPDHVRHLLGCADAVCAARGTQLTSLRRAVLGLLLQSPSPTGAYALLDRLSALQGSRIAPPTVYRALDFLVAEGLVHKLARIAAYVPCTHHLAHEHDHPPHGHSVQFLICSGCGRAAELEDAALGHALRQAAARVGFSLASAVVEADGLCAACAAVPG